MKIKKLRVFTTSALVFAVIGTLNACRDSKINNQSKEIESFKNNLEIIKFEDIFAPLEDKEINQDIPVSNKKNK